MSNTKFWPETGRSFPDSRVQRGMIRVISITFAPIIFPTDNDASLFAIAVMVVTSSGMDVPTAIRVAPIMASHIPKKRARLLP